MARRTGQKERVGEGSSKDEMDPVTNKVQLPGVILALTKLVSVDI